jgi:integrase
MDILYQWSADDLSRGRRGDSKNHLHAIGVGVSPHMFRTSAASSAAVHAGHNPHLASALLHHRDNRVTEEHYNRASSLSAANAFGKLIKKVLAQ